MIIEEVVIENFRSHRKSRITFDQGISVIVGENGSGKTSILDAVNYALFKSKPNKDINADDLIRRGSEEAVVSVRFHQNGRVYRVKRGRKKGRASGSAFYQITGKKEVTKVKGEGDITREVEDVLGITGELFTSAIYIKQGELDSLISATPSSRKEIVGKLLGAQDLETAHENMLEIVREYENRAGMLAQAAEGIKRTAGRIFEKREELNRLKSELKTITPALASMTKDVEEKEKEVMQIEEVKDLEMRRKEKAAKLSHIREKIRRIEGYENALKETASAARRYAELENELRSLGEDKNRLTKFREREANLERELGDTDRRRKTLEGSIAQAFERYGQLFETSIKDFKTLETFRETALKEAASADRRCAELENELRSLGEDKNRLTKFREREANLARQLDDTKGRRKTLEGSIAQAFERYGRLFETSIKDFKTLETLRETALKDLESKEKTAGEKKERLRYRLSGLESRTREAQKALGELTGVGNECPVCKTQLTKERKEGLKDEYRAGIESNAAEIIEIESKIKKMVHDEEETKALLKKIRSINLEVLENEIEELDAAIHKYDEATIELDKNKKDLAGLADLEDRLRIKETEKRELERGNKAWLKKIQSIKLEVLENEIEELDAAIRKYDKATIELDKNKKDLADLTGLEDRLRTKETEKLGLEQENERHIEARGFLRKNLPEKSGLMKRADVCIEEMERLKEEMEKRLLNVSLESFDPESIPQLLTKARLELEKQRKELQHLMEKKTKSEYGVQIGKRAVKDLNDELMKLKEKEKERQKLEKFGVFLTKIRNLFHKDRLQRELRANSKPIVERYTREVFDRFDLPYSDVELTDDFGMVVFCADGEESVDMLSGGEKIAAALALRIGIARAISGPSMELVILDEPTIHLDTQRRLELVEIVKKLFTIPQTIVVTHDKEFENAADVLITVEKVGGISKVRYEGD